MTRRLRLFHLALPLGLALTCGARALAAAAPGGSSGTLETPNYRIVTDHTDTNLQSGEFTMPHTVRFSRPGTDATGSRAKGNYKQGTVSLYGNVVIHDSGNAPEAKTGGAYQGSGPATLTCDQFDVDSKAKLYVATGNVHFSQGERTATAAKAILDRTRGTLHLEGDVHLMEKGSTLNANTVDYNLNTKDAELNGTPVMITQPANQPPPAAPQRRPTGKPSPARTAKPAAKPSVKPSPQASATARPKP